MRESDERIGFHWYLQDSGKPERWNANIASFARIGVFNHETPRHQTQAFGPDYLAGPSLSSYGACCAP